MCFRERAAPVPGRIRLQRSQLNRRDFIAFLGGALAWPDEVRSQQPQAPMIGFLNSGSSDQFAPFVNAFRQGLNDGGYVEGRNVAIEYRWAEGQSARLPELAADLVRRRVSLIAATGGSVSAKAARDATATLPVLFIGASDPVAEGLVSSLDSPDSNLTGVAVKASELFQKRLELLLQLIPGATKIALLLNPNGVDADAVTRDFEMTTRALWKQPILLKTGSASDLEAAFVSAVQQRVDVLLVTTSPLFTNSRSQIVSLAARHAVPAACAWREFAEAGGLLKKWSQYSVGIPPDRSVCEPDPQRRETTRPSGADTYEIRAGHQHESREGTRSNRAARRARWRR